MNDEQELIEIPDDELMLTTVDNPHNPKVDYAKWRKWDRDNGYYTEELIARLVEIPEDVDDIVTINKITLGALYLVLDADVLNIYKLC